ncbi:MAG: hypothetical protein HKN23_09955 [Verrucomicrobiales bacterium]|nr:hypothetical protein [Verrucomicrobiales bacterium]
MKTRHLIPVLIGLAALLPSALEANPIKSSNVFRGLEGKWKGSGELVDPEGNKSEVVETWTGKFTEEGNFVMSGTRKLGQMEHGFAWEFYANGDLVEGQMKIEDPEIDARFEIVLDEEARSIKMTIPLSDSTMTIVNTVSKDGKTILGTVKIDDDSGNPGTTGEVKHEKQK